MISVLVSCEGQRQEKTDRLKNTIYKIGFKTDSASTGPLSNSAFIIKINDAAPTLLLTAHHVVAGTPNGEFVKWNEVAGNIKNGWAWSMDDGSYNFKLGKNLPIRNAETLKLDLAAFYLTSDTIPYLKAGEKDAQVGDTVYLFSVVQYENQATIKNKGVVIYATDSIMAYELSDFNMTKVSIMSGTSGSCVLNDKNEVISNSYAGFTTPNEEVRKEIAARFPLLNKLHTRDGKTYGVGLPISIIKESVVLALGKKSK
jgi:V8-like Glu-specific endopeptidase